MSEVGSTIVDIRQITKRYQIFQNPGDRLLHALGLSQIVFWRRRSVKELWALNGVTLNVRKGERVGIVGRNGAGKSTLLKIVARTVAPTSGDAIVRGRVRALLELGIGFHPELTGRENIRTALAYEGVRDSNHELEREIIDFAELGESIEQPLRTFSSGMFTRLAFSVATAVSPDLLIIDEILATGDAYFVGKCFERLQRLSDQQAVAVLMASHDLTAVQALCHRALWIEHGIVKHEGSPLEVLREYGRSIRREEEARLRIRDRAARESPRTDSEKEHVSSSEYGSKEIVITGISLSTGDCHDVKSLYCLEPCEVVVEWKACRSVTNPVFVFCIYLPSGACASQWIASSREMGTEIVSGQGTVTFRSDRLLLGSGYYVASVGVFAEMPNRGLEAAPYHVLDRCVYFQVVEQSFNDQVNYGICRQPVATELRIHGRP